MNTPSIYVADLAAYNAGYLHGVWIDATQDVADIWQAVREMLKASPVAEEAEEWAIHDYSDFGSLRLSEYMGFEEAHDLACFIEEHGDLGIAVLENFGEDIETARRCLEEDYAGEYESAAHFAEEITTETSEVPEHLAYYIDYDAMARDMQLNGDIFTVETGCREVHIFWNR